MKKTFISRAKKVSSFFLTTAIIGFFSFISAACVTLIGHQPHLFIDRPAFSFLGAFIILAPLTYVLTCFEHKYRPRGKRLNKNFSSASDLARVSIARLLIWSSVYLFWHIEFLALAARIGLPGLYGLFAFSALIGDIYLIAHWLVYEDYESETPGFLTEPAPKGGGR